MEPRGVEPLTSSLRKAKRRIEVTPFYLAFQVENRKVKNIKMAQIYRQTPEDFPH